MRFLACDCNALQCTATHGNARQYTATYTLRPTQFWNCYAKKRFLSYDYGPLANLRLYGTERPVCCCSVLLQCVLLRCVAVCVVAVCCNGSSVAVDYMSREFAALRHRVSGVLLQCVVAVCVVAVCCSVCCCSMLQWMKCCSGFHFL